MVNKKEAQTKTNIKWYKRAILPWAIIIVVAFGTTMFAWGWYSRSSNQAQFDALSSQIQSLKTVK